MGGVQVEFALLDFGPNAALHLQDAIEAGAVSGFERLEGGGYGMAGIEMQDGRPCAAGFACRAYPLLDGVITEGHFGI